MALRLWSLGVRSADQDTFHGNLIYRSHDHTARGLDFHLQVARQPFALAEVCAVALTQQHRAARLQFLCEGSNGFAGAGDILAMRLGLPGRAVDFAGAVADRDDEAGGGGRVLRHLAGRCALLRHRAADIFENGADRLDRLRNPMYRVRRARGVLLQRLDILGDLLRGVLGLHRERLHFGRNHGEAAPGFASPRRFDGGIEREQRGLSRDLRDQIDDIADRGRGFAQAVHDVPGFLGGSAGLIGELAGVAHLRADAVRRLGEFFRHLREGGRGTLGGAGSPGQRVGALADGGESRCGSFGAAGDRVGRALELADHRAQLEFQKFKDFLCRIALVGSGNVARRSRLGRLRLDGSRSRFGQPLSKQTERHGSLWDSRKSRAASSHPGVKSGLTIAS